MKRIIILIICAVCLILSASAQRNDYYIDGKPVENFDGSQLVGKTIKHYEITRLKSVNIHTILTSDDWMKLEGRPASTSSSANGVTVQTRTKVSEATDSVATTSTTPRIETYRNPLIILDGEIFAGKVNEIKPTDIKSINVYKPNSDVARSYGEQGKNGVMEIFTNGQTDAITYFINGEPATKEAFNRLSPSEIKTVKVLRRGSAAAMEASPDGKKNDIYQITTK